jgi:hypothetical protein
VLFSTEMLLTASSYAAFFLSPQVCQLSLFMDGGDLVR